MKRIENIYKNWQIETAYVTGYYQATNLNDCDAKMLFDKSIEGIKTQIDEL